ncbi:MAG: ABC transporter permease [Planctomycetota bacterium]|nr:MAG: ABC transporter permease [Planctomycetota bacterium]
MKLNKVANYPFPLSTIAEIGKSFKEFIYVVGYTTRIGLECFLYIPYVFLRWRGTVKQMYISGVGSLGVVLIVAAFTGMIIATQTGLELKRFGQEEFIGGVVAVSICREMGPFMTGLILAATVTSSMTAEIGTMAVSEELDALEVMSISPVKFLVAQRVFALTIMCPAVTVVTDIVGIFGGAIVGATNLDVSFASYYENAKFILSMNMWPGNLPKDVLTGILKSFVFGFVISVIGCAQGLLTTNGAMGVGKSTRLSVVYSYLMVIILGFLLTYLFYFAF